MKNLEKIANQFMIHGEYIDAKSIDEGIINTTFVVTVREEEVTKRYLLQKINTGVFNQPFQLMNNIATVTDYIGKQIEEEGGDLARETLTVIKTKKGKPLYIQTEEGVKSYWRCYNFIEAAQSYNRTDDLGIICNAAKAFATFAYRLRNYPIEKLETTLPDFHNTPLKYKKFLKDIEDDAVGRVDSVQSQIEAIKSRVENIFWLENLISVGEIPIRAVHNDTKLNNVLIDIISKKGICVIDLDTVQPGSIIIDICDAIRFLANYTLEDDPDVEKVGLNLEIFESFINGYFSKMAKELRPKEVEHVVDGCLLVTNELAIRFLDDYINGDTYFKTDYDNHNLVRANNQLALLKDMEEKYEVMKEMVKEAYKRYKI